MSRQLIPYQLQFTKGARLRLQDLQSIRADSLLVGQQNA